MTERGPTGEAAGPRDAVHVTAREWLVVYLCVLGAAAVAMNRQLLPMWARAETYDPPSQVARRTAFLLASRPPGELRWFQPTIRLDGAPMLVVGDSLVAKWPWPADLMMYPGHTTFQICDRLADELAERDLYYDQIILWAGTASLAGGQAVSQMVEGVVQTADLLQAYGDAVYVLGPMPLDEQQHERLRSSGNIFASRILSNTLALSTAAVTDLEERLPGLVVHDLRPFRNAATAADQFHLLYSDGMHLKEAGFAALREDLIRTGLDFSATSRVPPAGPPGPVPP